LQLTLRDAMGAALHAALADIGVTTAPKPLYDYCHYAIFPRVVHDADVGMLPDNPQEWFQQQLLQSEFQKENPCPHHLAERDALKRAAELIAEARLSPSEVAAMLTQAGGSQPADPAAIVQLAADCLVLFMENRAWIREVSDWKTHMQAWRKAEKLCDNLRSLPPVIIRDSAAFDALVRPDHSLTAQFRRRTAQFRILRRVLEDLHFESPPSELLLQPPRWHDGAVRVAKAYRENINPEAGWSRSGPAVRFLLEVLCRAYPGAKITAAAVELHLTRQRRA
jgi:hypothetical protein